MVEHFEQGTKGRANPRICARIRNQKNHHAHKLQKKNFRLNRPFRDLCRGISTESERKFRTKSCNIWERNLKKEHQGRTKNAERSTTAAATGENWGIRVPRHVRCRRGLRRAGQRHVPSNHNDLCGATQSCVCSQREEEKKAPDRQGEVAGTGSQPAGASA